LVDALYATQMASANDGANLLAEYFGGGTIADSTRRVSAPIMQYAGVWPSAGPAAAAPGTSTVPIKSSTVHSAAVNFFIWYTPLVSFMPVRHHLEYTTFFPAEKGFTHSFTGISFHSPAKRK